MNNTITNHSITEKINKYTSLSIKTKLSIPIHALQILLIVLLFISCQQNLCGQRIMENLGRGLVAVNEGGGKVFISWRSLAKDPTSIAFNIYRKSGTGNLEHVKLNTAPLTGGTNFQDKGADITKLTTYYLRPVVNGKEQNSIVFALPANSPVVNYLSIPLKPGEYYVQHIWPGDLDGDGEYDLVVSRIPRSTGTPIVEGYKLNGTFLWRIDMGPNSSAIAGGNGSNDAAPANISGWANVAGYRGNDNVTVYDLNSDGKAEVLIRTAPGVIFGDGQILTNTNNAAQFFSVIDGLTGKEKTRASLPSDYLIDGPMGGHLGIAYLDGVHPSLVAKLSNRIGAKRGSFNLLIAAYDYNGTNLNLRWKWLRRSNVANNFHQIRIMDVNGDGKDDVCDGSYVIKNDGTYLYTVPEVIHGDRFHITDMDPDSPGLEGYGIQQYEDGSQPKFPWYYYKANQGQIIRSGGAIQVDVARGTIGDIDPNHRGYEMWSYNGIYNVRGEQISTTMPTPNFTIWWDGDLLGELLNNTTIDEWNYEDKSLRRILTTSGVRNTWRNAPPFYGDILGDWREEVIWETDDYAALRIYTTTIPTDHRIYTLPHNPGYRPCFTVKGYLQSNAVDYYLGYGMTTPPNPAITLANRAAPSQKVVTSDLSETEWAGDNNQSTTIEDDEFHKNIYPNPFISTVEIKTPGAFDYIIKNELGNVVEEGSGHNFCMAGSRLNSGIYLLVIKTEKKTRTVKLIKR